MTMKRSKEPWMPADDFGRSLPRGIGVNLLVRDMAAELAFCRDCLGAMVLDSDEDFAAIELCGSVFMLHADHSYSHHPMSGIVAGSETRGAGIEIRVYGLDPDKAEAGRESAATMCWRAASTSRTDCGSASSSIRKAMSGFHLHKYAGDN
ncbi:hypothetical protein ABWH89_04110 [Hoeflea alexandrii]|uniref:hypothetical protein n=1 Tax=Hoeflea alexandrii TaxID=288436 RepID=UPI0035D0A278